MSVASEGHPSASAGHASAAEVGPPSRPIWLAMAAVAALTVAEILVARSDGERALRITALAGLLMAKVGWVLLIFMRARARAVRVAARFVVAALLLSAGYAVVLMLEAAFRARVGGGGG